MNWNTKAMLRELDHSFLGLPARRYRDMKARIKGSPHKRSNSVGLELISKEEFIAWCYLDPDYNKLYSDWLASAYSPELIPSIHRLDNSIGYVIGNMKWLTRLEHIGR